MCTLTQINSDFPPSALSLVFDLPLLLGTEGAGVRVQAWYTHSVIGCVIDGESFSRRWLQKRDVPTSAVTAFLHKISHVAEDLQPFTFHSTFHRQEVAPKDQARWCTKLQQDSHVEEKGRALGIQIRDTCRILHESSSHPIKELGRGHGTKLHAQQGSRLNEWGSVSRSLISEPP